MNPFRIFSAIILLTCAATPASTLHLLQDSPEEAQSILDERLAEQIREAVIEARALGRDIDEIQSRMRTSVGYFSDILTCYPNGDREPPEIYRVQAYLFADFPYFFVEFKDNIEEIRLFREVESEATRIFYHIGKQRGISDANLKRWGSNNGWIVADAVDPTSVPENWDADPAPELWQHMAFYIHADATVQRNDQRYTRGKLEEGDYGNPPWIRSAMGMFLYPNTRGKKVRNIGGYQPRAGYKTSYCQSWLGRYGEPLPFTNFDAFFGIVR